MVKLLFRVFDTQRFSSLVWLLPKDEIAKLKEGMKPNMKF